MSRQIIDGDLIVIDSNGNEVNVLDSVNFPSSLTSSFSRFRAALNQGELKAGKYYLISYGDWTDEQKAALLVEFISRCNNVNTNIIQNTWSGTCVTPSIDNTRFVANEGALLLRASGTNTIFPEFIFYKKVGDNYIASEKTGKVEVINPSNSTTSAFYISYMRDKFNNECSYDFDSVEYNIVISGEDISLWSSTSSVMQSISRYPVDVPGNYRTVDFTSSSAFWTKTFTIHNYIENTDISLDNTNGFYRNISLIDSYGCVIYTSNKPYSGSSFDFTKLVKGQNIKLINCVSCYCYAPEILDVLIENSRNICAASWHTSQPGPDYSRTITGGVYNIIVKKSFNLNLCIMDLNTSADTASPRLKSESGGAYGSTWSIYNTQNIEVIDSKMKTLFYHSLSISGDVSYTTSDTASVVLKGEVYLPTRTCLGSSLNSGITYNNLMANTKIDDLFAYKNIPVISYGALPRNTNANPHAVSPACILIISDNGFPTIYSSMINDDSKGGRVTVMNNNQMTLSEQSIRGQD